ncbi:hypothetical protein [Rubripirellula reticaptiva]|uniref:Uncharacterized protein n=1 Tax=Rubripirellula reticaptiva TaxID=2528013 RepID=A0A5C6F5F6_9BACT|nr:hypothetical protein [Rubripirellula reticaptiva]TWU55780.1 hypothetical protein Poly59_20820 [Rubripirellula reticaptiva]
MGGVPVLMMIAAMGMGITYGWQPDENADGVQYIVQVPSSEVDQLQRIGEISSVVDPAVRGRVTKIVIRVGDGLLPHKMPSATVESDFVANSDATSIAIPEMASVSPSMKVPMKNTAGKTTAMKPDPQGGTQGGGFSFPTTPSLTDAANTARTNIDRAGREIADRTSQALGQAFGSGGTGAGPSTADARSSALVPPPSTRPQAASTAARSNAGGNAGFAAPPLLGQNDRSGNSASPWGTTAAGATERDNNWGDPDRVAAARDASNANTLSTNGLRSTDTFGRPPAGLAPPNSVGGSSNSYGQPNSSATNSRTPAVSQYDQIMADRRAQQARQQQEELLLQEQQQRLAKQRLEEQRREQQLLAQRQESPTQLQPPVTSRDTRNDYSSRSSLSGNGLTYREATQTTPDSRLTAAQLAAGAWAVDEQNRIYDTRRQLMPNEYLLENAGSDASQYRSQPVSPFGESASNPSTFPTPEFQSPSFASASDRNLSGQFGGQSQTNWANGPIGGARYGEDDRESIAAGRPTFNSSSQYPRESLVNSRPPATESRGSQTSEARGTAGSSVNFDLQSGQTNQSSGFSDPPQVAAQPLFNGLLLISFVANVYLIFWLKNLRLQFRDMVASKRQATSSSIAA